MFRRWLSVGLVHLLIFSGVPSLWGAQAESAPKLRIIILEGEGALNDIRQRKADEPVVQVQDENNRPVAGAVVVFTLPDRGASGLFANGQTSMTVLTGQQGRASGAGLHPNSVPGDVQIRVDASYQGQKASATISQTNTLAGAQTAKRGGSGKTIGLLLAIAGGAAAGGVAVAGRGGNKPSAPAPVPTGPPATSVAMGTPTVSAPPR